MADEDDVRRLALTLPGVEEIDSDGFDFRVGGKGFVWSYPERKPGRVRARRRTSSSSAIVFPPGSAPSGADRPVDQFPHQVSMPVVLGVLLDHVVVDPAQATGRRLRCSLSRPAHLSSSSAR